MKLKFLIIISTCRRVTDKLANFNQHRTYRRRNCLNYLFVRKLGYSQLSPERACFGNAILSIIFFDGTYTLFLETHTVSDARMKDYWNLEQTETNPFSNWNLSNYDKWIFTRANKSEVNREPIHSAQSDWQKVYLSRKLLFSTTLGERLHPPPPVEGKIG